MRRLQLHHGAVGAQLDVAGALARQGQRDVGVAALGGKAGRASRGRSGRLEEVRRIGDMGHPQLHHGRAGPEVDDARALGRDGQADVRVGALHRDGGTRPGGGAGDLRVVRRIGDVSDPELLDAAVGAQGDRAGRLARKGQRHIGVGPDRRHDRRVARGAAGDSDAVRGCRGMRDLELPDRAPGAEGQRAGALGGQRQPDIRIGSRGR